MDPSLTSALDALAATPRTLAHLVAEVTEERLEWADDGAEWSPRVVIAHLRDGEYLEFRLAIERILAEEAPVCSTLDPVAWLEGRNRSRDRREFLLADFALQRQATLGILRTLRVEEWQRTGQGPLGTFTLETLVRAGAERDAEHIARLESALGETLEMVLARRARPE